MHRKILFGIIAAVVCGLFVSSPSAKAGGVVTSASRYQSGGNDIWTFYYDTSSNVTKPAYYWIDGTYIGNPADGGYYFTVTVATGTYGWDNNAIYVYGGTTQLPTYVIFHPDGTYQIYLQ